MLSVKRDLLDRCNDKDTSSVVIADNIIVTVLGFDGSAVRLGIEAPDDVSIWRGELYREIEDKAKALSAIKSKSFKPPTCDDVDLYIMKMGYSGFTGLQFCSFYESKGWMVGSNKMKNWRAAVRTWAAKERNGR